MYIHLGVPGLKDDGMDCPVAGSLGRTVSRLRQRNGQAGPASHAAVVIDAII